MVDQAAAPVAGTALERVGPALKASVEKVIAAGLMGRIEQHPQWPLLAKLPLLLRVAVPIPDFRVKNLLALNVGQVIATKWSTSEDQPLEVGAVKLGWGEFEVVEQRMAIRLTRLA